MDFVLFSLTSDLSPPYAHFPGFLGGASIFTLLTREPQFDPHSPLPREPW